MSLQAVERIADALLFEGYMLYPYRPSAVKNQQRFNFGVVYPEECEVSAAEGADAHLMITECLAEGNANTTLHIKVRFLQLVQRTTIRSTTDEPVRPWQEGVERSMTVRGMSFGELTRSQQTVPFTFPASEIAEPAPDGDKWAAGRVVRSQRTINATLELSAAECPSDPGVFKIRLQVHNRSAHEARSGATPTAARDERLLHALVSTHSILSVSGGAFISLLDPPAEYRSLAAACRGTRSWPVLVGNSGQRDTMLSSPIIIYDYPLIAPESAGDLFDGTEIDEILSLRIMTMTDAEKHEMRHSDARARALLQRTEALGAEDLMRMHGTMREIQPTDSMGSEAG